MLTAFHTSTIIIFVHKKSEEEPMSAHEIPGHKGDAAVSCIDPRFRAMTNRFLEERFGTEVFDPLTWAGSIEKIVNPETRDDYMKYELSVSIELHEIKRLVFVAHKDCGWYKGIVAFSSAKEEDDRMKGDLRKARDFVKESYPELVFELFLLDPSTGNFEEVE